MEFHNIAFTFGNSNMFRKKKEERKGRKKKESSMDDIVHYNKLNLIFLSSKIMSDPH